MHSFLANIVVILVLGFIVWRRGRDRRVESVALARWLRIAALVPLALQIAIFLLFGVAEMVGGDLGGAGHLLQIVEAALLALLAWMRPLEGGAGLLIAGAFQVVSMAMSMFTAMTGAEPTMISPALLILGVPLIVSGALFFVAGVLARRAATGAAGQDQ